MPARRTPLLVALGAVGLVLGVIAAATGAGWLGLIAGLVAVALAAIAVLTPAAVTAVPSAPPVASPAPVAAPAEAPAAASVPATPPSVPMTTDSAPATESAGVAAPAAEPVVATSLSDPATGLFNEEFFRVAVETRVSAARRHLRPVAIVLFEVAEVDGDGNASPAGATSVAAAIRETLREADTACRLVDGRFAFVLEDTPEDGAIWTVERLRRKLSETAGTQIRWAGIACYPAHAFSATEALTKAERAFLAAKEWAQDRIEVATAD